MGEQQFRSPGNRRFINRLSGPCGSICAAISLDEVAPTRRVEARLRRMLLLLPTLQQPSPHAQQRA